MLSEDPRGAGMGLSVSLPDSHIQSGNWRAGGDRGLPARGSLKVGLIASADINNKGAGVSLLDFHLATAHCPVQGTAEQMQWPCLDRGILPQAKRTRPYPLSCRWPFSSSVAVWSAPCITTLVGAVFYLL